MRSGFPRSTPSSASASRTVRLISSLNAWVGATSKVSSRVAGSSASQARAALSPSSSCATSCTLLPSSSTASPGSPARTACTAARSSGVRWRWMSFIVTVGIPASCKRRKGWPASTGRSCLMSPTSTTRATSSRSAARRSERIWAVETIEASSSTSTAPPKISFNLSSASPFKPAVRHRARNHCSVRA